jgi:hypothetical protein
VDDSQMVLSNAATSDALSLNGTTTGGIVGSVLTVTAVEQLNTWHTIL